MSDTDIRGTVFTTPSHWQKVHELTMLHLKNKNLDGITPDELVQMYQKTSEAINNAFKY